jgi:hypothetical protein
MDFWSFLSFSVWFGRWMHKRGGPALSALEVPSASPRVATYRKAALGFFMGFAALFLRGSLIGVFVDARIGEVVSWTGVGCCVIAAICVVRSASLNAQQLAANSAALGTCRQCGGPAVIHMTDVNPETGETTCHHWCMQHAIAFLQTPGRAIDDR